MLALFLPLNYFEAKMICFRNIAFKHQINLLYST